MKLSTIDLLIIVAYLITTVVIGLLLKKGLSKAKTATFLAEIACHGICLAFPMPPECLIFPVPCGW